jgi:type IV secretion system protein VirD4
MKKSENGTTDGKERIYYVGDDVHTLCIGATRSGKSRIIVIQSICTLGLAGESLIISDPKAELYHYTSGFLERLGYDVKVLDFKNPEKSHRYNLLQPIIDAVNDGDFDKAEMRAWDLTNTLTGKQDTGEKIWHNGEMSVIAASILCVVCDNKPRPEFQNLTNVYWFIAEMAKTIGGKMPLLEYVKKLPQSHPAKALLSISDVAPSRTRSSFYTSALTTLRLFTSKSIYGITNKSDFSLTDVGEKKQALFIILPDEKTTFYPVASLVISQQYELLANMADKRGGRLKQRVNFMLDEFGNFTTIADFTNKLTVGGGRGMRFNLFLQSFAQLEDKYDKNTASTIKSNCQVWIYLQADDPETLKEISEKLGTYTTSSYQLSASHQKFSTPSSSHSLNLTQRS